MNHKTDLLDGLIDRLRAGDTAALARAISLVDGNQQIGQVLHRRLRRDTGAANVIGITGPPGVGKSTLINSLLTKLRDRGDRVAVIAVDPSSPISGGAVLGDRTRMGHHTDDDGVFIRSISARGHLGGLSTSILQIVDLVDAAGWPIVILETVGAGQSETEIAEIADINVVLNAPGLGDDVQAIKAGILEIADVLVVNKADMPLAEATERQLKSMLKLRSFDQQQVPVLKTIANSTKGIDELLSATQEVAQQKFRDDKAQRRLFRSRRQVAQAAAEAQRRQILYREDPQLTQLIQQVAEGQIGVTEAVEQILTGNEGAKGSV